MDSIILHTHDGQRLEIPAGREATLERAIFLAGVWADTPLCSGLGKCGLCRVRFVSEPPAPRPDDTRKLGDKGVALGWRLACLHPADPCELELPRPVSAPRTLRIEQATGPYSLAVDLGTTTIHWQALVHGKVAASGSGLNPQTGLGAEVMSRLAYAADDAGRETLRTLVTDRLLAVTAELDESLGGPCEALVVSGNPAMIYLLLGLDPAPLSRAPYALTYRGGDEQKVHPDLPPAYIPPLAAPFVGADLTAGLTALELAGTGFPYLLADLGTNGEFILAFSPETRLCASVPLGPALEGVGLTFGRTASPGAVAGFDLSPTGLTPIRLEGTSDQGPGMTGTGYLALTAILLRHSILDQEGRFAEGTTPLAARLAKNLGERNGEPIFQIEPGLYLAASDVEEILKVKAAFNLAMSALLAQLWSGLKSVDSFHLAGALGEHVSLDDLEILGFLPPTTKARTKKAGNTSLAGSALLAASGSAREFAASLAPSFKLIDLTGSADFGQQFIDRMRFTYVH